MNTPNYQGGDAVVLSVILDADVGSALDRAAGEVLSSRAGHARRLLVESLRRSGHLPELTIPSQTRPKAAV